MKESALMDLLVKQLLRVKRKPNSLAKLSTKLSFGETKFKIHVIIVRRKDINNSSTLRAKIRSIASTGKRRSMKKNDKLIMNTNMCY
ncbi:hypothetical protein ACJMK2_027003 [Sinanodonta woodiana]|uniref:Uncharacterized protein n=1 Tax=Sinanodonta woodiana TaxID=1069815 RepID=A0ABD3XPQ6_SINWO